MENLKNLLESEKVKIAQLPKGNNWMYNNNDLIEYDKISNLKGLIVYTVEHDYAGSSAWMQNYTLEKLGIDDIKSMFLVVSKDNVKDLYTTLKAMPNYIGGGAGSGLKDIILPYMDELEKSAQDLKSVNAIYKNDENKIIGFNTDGIGYRLGLEKFLKNDNLSLDNKKIVVIGAGGVALPIVYELVKINPSKIIIANRTVEKAQAISDYINNVYQKDITMASGEDKLKDDFNGASLIVNVSNKGADGRFVKYSAFAPITESLDEHYKIAKDNLKGFDKNGLISDIVLVKSDLSSSLKLAKELGYKIQDGKKMVLNQGVPAFKKILSNTYLKNNKSLDTQLRKYMQESLNK